VGYLEIGFIQYFQAKFDRIKALVSAYKNRLRLALFSTTKLPNDSSWSIETHPFTWSILQMNTSLG